MIKRKLIGIGVVVAVLGLSGCVTKISPQSMNASEEVLQTFTVTTGKIDNHQSFLGHVVPVADTAISSKIGGKIIKMHVKKGQKVKQDQILLVLDSAEAQIAYQASASIGNALDTTYGYTQDMFDAQIQAMEQKVAQAKIARELSQLQDENGLAVAGRKIEQSKLANEAKSLELSHSIQLLQQQEAQLYSNAKNALSNAQILLDDVGEFTDRILGLSQNNQAKNDDYEIYIGAKNTAQKNSTEQTRRELKKTYEVLALQNIQTQSNILTGEELKQFLYTKLTQTESFLQEVNSFLSQITTTLENSVSSAILPQMTLDARGLELTKLQQYTEQALLTAQGNYMLGVKGTRQAIENFNTQSTMQIDLLTKQKELVDQQFAVDKESILQNSKLAEQQYQEALAGLSALKAQKSASLAEINTQVAQIKGQKNMAGQNIENAIITAPFEGTITEKYVEVGQVVGPGMPIYQLANLQLLKIVIYVAEKDAKSLVTGQTATIYSDIENKYCSGSIESIAPSADLATKKRTVELISSTCKQLLTPGSYVKVDLDQSTQPQTLVPNSFIQYQYGNAFVYKVTTGETPSTKKIPLQVLTCDNTYCAVSGEILDGEMIVQK